MVAVQTLYWVTSEGDQGGLSLVAQGAGGLGGAKIRNISNDAVLHRGLP